VPEISRYKRKNVKKSSARCSKHCPLPHCRVLPPGELGDMMTELFLIYSERFIGNQNQHIASTTLSQPTAQITQKKTSRINITKIRLTNIQTNTSSISKITLHMIYELSLNQKFCLQFATQMGHSFSLGTRQSTMSLFWNSNDQTHTNIHWFIHCHITNIPVNCSDWISTTS